MSHRLELKRLLDLISLRLEGVDINETRRKCAAMLPGMIADAERMIPQKLRDRWARGDYSLRGLEDFLE